MHLRQKAVAPEKGRREGGRGQLPPAKFFDIRVFFLDCHEKYIINKVYIYVDSQLKLFQYHNRNNWTYLHVVVLLCIQQCKTRYNLIFSSQAKLITNNAPPTPCPTPKKKDSVGTADRKTMTTSHNLKLSEATNIVKCQVT